MRRVFSVTRTRQGLIGIVNFPPLCDDIGVIIYSRRFRLIKVELDLQEVVSRAREARKDFGCLSAAVAAATVQITKPVQNVLMDRRDNRNIFLLSFDICT